MKKFNGRAIIVNILFFSFVFGFILLDTAKAAITPSLGVAETYGVLGSTYTNTTAGTTIDGDVGYTTPPAVMPTIGGTTHIADGAYNTAGTDQGSALSALNSQACDFNFGSPTDLSLLSQPLTPGVYCITAAASIGTGGITLSGSGSYIFRINGALTTVANSNVTGASSCNVFWTPTAATTLGANSTFLGTVIDAAGITVGSTVTWTGRALAFGGTVTTDTDTINVPSCSVPPPAPPVLPVVIPITTPTPTPPIVTPTPTPTTPTPTPTPVVTTVVTPTPTLPKTGFPPEEKGSALPLILLAGLSAFSIFLYFAQKKQTI